MHKCLLSTLLCIVYAAVGSKLWGMRMASPQTLIQLPLATRTTVRQWAQTIQVAVFQKKAVARC